jgi:hypothetical protein
VVALCQAPFLLDDPNVGLLFPADAIAKAKHYLAMTTGGLGIFFLPAFPCISFGKGWKHYQVHWGILHLQVGQWRVIKSHKY